MTGSHDRFDELAVGHVLGGLSEDDASRFRTHLVGCRDCRARVSELRSMASDLEVAAREERAAQRLRVDTPPVTEDDQDDEDDFAIDGRRRWLFVAAAGVVAVLAVLAVWNQALRLDNATLVGTTAVREDVLATLGDGRALPVTTRAGVTGVAALDEVTNQVAISLGHVGALAEMNRVVVWVDDGTADQPRWRDVVVLEPERLVGERLALVVPVSPDSRELVVSVEQSVVPDQPNAAAVFRADLTG